MRGDPPTRVRGGTALHHRRTCHHNSRHSPDGGAGRLPALLGVPRVVGDNCRKIKRAISGTEAFEKMSVFPHQRPTLMRETLRPGDTRAGTDTAWGPRV